VENGSREWKLENRKNPISHFLFPELLSIFQSTIFLKLIKFFMKTSFKFKNVHSCEAVVLTCIDFRFWRETVEFAEQELGIKSFDFPSLPGGAKAINDSENLAFACVSVPCDLHHVKKIVIVNHEDCGAYGGSEKFNGDTEAEQKFHEGELQKAKDKILEKYPDKEVIILYARLVDNKEKIEFLQIY
jgi:carbonic anhydrase